MDRVIISGVERDLVESDFDGICRQCGAIYRMGDLLLIHEKRRRICMPCTLSVESECQGHGALVSVAEAP